ncbi:MAG: alanine racemase, partial [Acidobacteria bacterium]|nr:alanine racemase [Acidobacteriota bacterium]
MSGTTDSGRESEDFGGLGRPTWAEINLGNLRHNLREVRHRLTRRAQLMAVVKADAYGHGAVKCARVLEDAGADWFGVALPEEGYELRAAGVRIPILCTGG